MDIIKKTCTIELHGNYMKCYAFMCEMEISQSSISMLVKLNCLALGQEQSSE